MKERQRYRGSDRDTEGVTETQREWSDRDTEGETETQREQSDRDTEGETERETDREKCQGHSVKKKKGRVCPQHYQLEHALGAD